MRRELSSARHNEVFFPAYLFHLFFLCLFLIFFSGRVSQVTSRRFGELRRVLMPLRGDVCTWSSASRRNRNWYRAGNISVILFLSFFLLCLLLCNSSDVNLKYEPRFSGSIKGWRQAKDLNRLSDFVIINRNIWKAESRARHFSDLGKSSESLYYFFVLMFLVFRRNRI